MRLYLLSLSSSFFVLFTVSKAYKRDNKNTKNFRAYKRLNSVKNSKLLFHLRQTLRFVEKI